MSRFSLVLFFLVGVMSIPAFGQDKLTQDDLWEAARNGNLEKIEQALSDGVDVNSKTDYGSTALFYACDRGHNDVVRLLLDKGANPKLKDTFYNATPLTWAQMKGHHEIVGMLFGAGAKGADDALVAATNAKNLDLVKAILGSGAITAKGLASAKEKAGDSDSEELKTLLDDPNIKVAAEFEFTPEMAARYEGTFGNKDMRITVTAKDNKLQIKMPNGTSTAKAIDLHQFQMGPSSLEFKMDGDQIVQVQLDMFRQSHILKPVEATETEMAEKKPETKPKEDSTAKKEAKKEYGESSEAAKAADLAVSSNNWPGFRGNGARGVADGQGAPMKWNAEDSSNVAWKIPIPGLGNSCPTIWGERIFLTSAVNPDADNDFRIGLYGDVASVEEDFEFDFVVYCIDKNTGEILWQKTANHAKPAVKRHAKSSHANPTVATDGKHVIAFFGSEGMYCYDMEGNLKWEKQLGVLDSGWFYDPGYQWGFGASPTIFEDTVIVQCDIQKNSYVAAFRLSDGEEVWKTGREEIPSWSTPTVHEFGDTAMVITHATRAARGYDARTGEELWSMRDHSEIVVPVPFVAHDLIYLASGYSPIQPIVAVRPEARGDITLEGNNLSSDHIAWSTKRGGPYMPSPIVYGDYLYCCSNSGIVTCYDAKTGDQVYKKRMRAKGGTLSFTGSPLAADGHLYFTAEDGRTLVVKAGPKFELVETNMIGENVLTTPSISEGRMYIRGQKHLFAIENPEVEAPAGQ